MKSAAAWREFSRDMRRDEILDAIIRVIEERGLLDLSMRQIASAINLTVSTLTHYFGSKDQLYIQLFSRVLELRATRLYALAEGKNTLTGVLRELWEENIADSSLRRALVELEVYCHSLRRADQMKSALSTAKNTRRQLFRELIEKEGVPSKTAGTMAAVVEDAFTGFVLDYMSNPNSAHVKRAFECFTEMCELKLAAETRPAE